MVAISNDYIVYLGTDTSGEGIAYNVYLGTDNTGTLIYSGKAFAKPSETNVSVKVNDILADYLGQKMMEVTNSSLQMESAPFDLWFSVYVGDTRKMKERFSYNWSYDTAQTSASQSLHAPINGKLMDGMLAPLTARTHGTSEVASGATLSITIGATTTTAETTASTPFNALVKVALPSGVKATSLAIGVEGGSTASYTLEEKCHRYAVYYVNEYGGWDALVIEGKVAMTDGYTRSNYKKTYDNTTIAESGEINYRNDIARTWVLHTGWLTDAEAGRMHHLLGSTLVYLCDTNDANRMIPIAITNKNCPYKTRKNDGMVSFALECSYARSMERR